MESGDHREPGDDDDESAHRLAHRSRHAEAGSSGQRPRKQQLAGALLARVKARLLRFVHGTTLALLRDPRVLDRRLQRRQ